MNVLKKRYDFLGGEVMLFDKHLDWTSFDLVQRVRNTLCRRMGIKKMKVGHAGTLDPLASGLMILCTGKATKKIESLQEEEKEYLATIKTGATTPSYDLETEEIKVENCTSITLEQFTSTLQKFQGEQDQVPPLFSAVKVKGQRAFHMARKGQDVELQPKKIVIKSITVESFDPPFATIRVVCSKGTYIRALARDIGQELGCGAYLTALRRTRIGQYHVKDAMDVDYFLKNLDSFVTNHTDDRIT